MQENTFPQVRTLPKLLNLGKNKCINWLMKLWSVAKIRYAENF